MWFNFTTINNKTGLIFMITSMTKICSKRLKLNFPETEPKLNAEIIIQKKHVFRKY